MKENGFIFKKTKSSRYPAETMTDADYAADLSLLASLFDSPERVVRSTILSVYADKRDFMSFKQDGAMTILSGKPLKYLVQILQ